jgi:hypothetical protein
MGVGQYDMLKNPFAFFTDFDCTNIVNGLCMSYNMSGGTDVSSCVQMCEGMMGYPAVACDPAVSAPNPAFCSYAYMPGTCGAGSGSQTLPPPYSMTINMFTDADLFGASGFVPNMTHPFLGACVNFMQSNFDLALSTPPGTFKAMGILDGINGLQGFVIRETIDGSTDGCNPITGTANIAAYMLAGGNFANISGGVGMAGLMGDANNCMPSTFSGVCSGATPSTNMMGACAGGFNNGKMCLGMNIGMPGGANADCIGNLPSAEATHNPFGLVLSRGEARARFATQLQQSSVVVAGPSAFANENINSVWWPILTEQNPDNLNHKWAWDMAGSANECGAFQNEPCCTNPMNPMQAVPCSNGMNVRTTIHANQLLGFTPAQYSLLTSLYQAPPLTGTAPVARYSYSATGLTVAFTASASTGTITSYAWDFGDAASTATGVNPSHTFTASGTYTVSLNVTGPGGNNVKIETLQITAPNHAPVAGGSAVTNGLSVTVTDASTDSDLDVLGVLVNWGDGTFSNTVQNGVVSHLYSGGTYSIYLHVTDKKGGSNTILVNGAPIALAASLGSISGTISDSTGTVLPNAVVSVYSASTGSIVEAIYSTSTGSYTLASLASGVYNVGAKLNGYSFDLVTNVTVTAPLNHLGVNIAANATHSVSGKINNAPTSGLLVQLTAAGQPTVVYGQALSYGQLGGGFKFMGITHGTYDIVTLPTGTHTVTPALVSGVTVTIYDVVSATTMTYN